MTVAFDGSRSQDLDAGDQVAYACDLGGDGQYDDSTAVSPHTSTSNGTVTAQLRVSVPAGASDTESATITVAPPVPHRCRRHGQREPDQPPAPMDRVCRVVTFAGASAEETAPVDVEPLALDDGQPTRSGRQRGGTLRGADTSPEAGAGAAAPIPSGLGRANYPLRHPMRTLVIIPAFNEEEALPHTLAELRSHHPTIDVVVVSDGSVDCTAAVGRDGGATVLELPFNLGIGGALRTGFLYAVREGYDTAVQFDADGQHDPAHIKTLTDALESGADMVIGNRFSEASAHYDVGGTRRSAMRLLQLTVRLLAGRRYSDTSSGFRGFNHDVLAFFARNYPSEYMESVESLILATFEGFDVVEVPVDMRQRAGGTPSSRRLKLAYHYLRLMLVLGSAASHRRRAPLRHGAAS